MLALNRPSGKPFVRFGTKSLEIELKTKKQVIRRCYGAENSYYLNKKKYVSFGKEVPEAIRHVLNMSDVNFQQQLDLPFWFAESASKISKNLNEIVNLELMDRSMQVAASIVKQRKVELKVSKLRLSAIKKDLKNLQWVPKCAESAKLLQAKRKDAQKARKSARLLASFLKEGEILQKRKDAVKTAIFASKKAIANGEAVLAISKRKRKLSNLVQEETRLEELRQLAVPDLSPILKKREQVQEASNDRSALEISISDQLDMEKQLCQLKERKRKLAKDLKRIQVGRCPTCGGQIKSQHLSYPTSTLDSTPRSAEGKKDIDGCPF